MPAIENPGVEVFQHVLFFKIDVVTVVAVNNYNMHCLLVK